MLDDSWELLVQPLQPASQRARISSSRVRRASPRRRRLRSTRHLPLHTVCLPSSSRVPQTGHGREPTTTATEGVRTPPEPGCSAESAEDMEKGLLGPRRALGACRKGRFAIRAQLAKTWWTCHIPASWPRFRPSHRPIGGQPPANVFHSRVTRRAHAHLEPRDLLVEDLDPFGPHTH